MLFHHWSAMIQQTYGQRFSANEHEVLDKKKLPQLECFQPFVQKIRTDHKQLDGNNTELFNSSKSFLYTHM